MIKKFRAGFFCTPSVALSVFAIICISVCHGQDLPDMPSTNALSKPGSKDVTPEQADLQAALKELPPLTEEYKKALDGFIAEFNDSSTKLKASVLEMRSVHTRLQNYQVKDEKERKVYYDLRDQARNLMQKTFEDGINLLANTQDILAINHIEENGGNFKHVTTYLVSMIKRNLDHSNYDLATLQAGGILMSKEFKMPVYVYNATARAATCFGDFAFAKQIYDVLDEKQLNKTDKALLASMERMEEDWEFETNLRKIDERKDDLPRIKFETSRGPIVAELFIDQAPSTVAHIINLVEDGYYDGLDWYQVVPDLLALTGDETGTGRIRNDKFLMDEHKRDDARRALRGSLVMAKIPVEGTPNFVDNSANTQFAITFLPMPVLTDQQTVFGRVIEGMDVAGYFRHVNPAEEKEKGAFQLPPDRIISAEVIRRPKELPEVKFATPVDHSGHKHPH